MCIGVGDPRITRRFGPKTQVLCGRVKPPRVISEDFRLAPFPEILRGKNLPIHTPMQGFSDRSEKLRASRFCPSFPPASGVSWTPPVGSPRLTPRLYSRRDFLTPPSLHLFSVYIETFFPFLSMTLSVCLCLIWIISSITDGTYPGQNFDI